MLPLDYALRNLARRRERTLLAGLACALVAALFVATTSFVRGLERTFASTAQADVGILLSRAAEGDLVRSAVTAGLASLVEASVEGVAAASEEIHMGTRIVVPEAGGSADEPTSARGRAGFVRGVTPEAYRVHDPVTLVEGRLPGPGEVIVGSLVGPRLEVDEAHLAIGKTLLIEGRAHPIVGRFVAPGSTIEAEVWTPLESLRVAAQRDDASAVFVRLEDESAFARLKLFTDRRLDLELEMLSSGEYYGELAAYFAPIRRMTWILAVMIAFACLLGGVNTSIAAVQDRLRELAMLRAVGYGGGEIAASLVQEALVLAAGGGVVGLGFARVLIDGNAVRIAMGAFSLEVDAVSVVTGLGAVVAIGVLGVVPAVVRVLRLPVAVALAED